MQEPEPLTPIEMDAVDTTYGRLGNNHYELLGVSSDADRPTIRAAYFEQMKRFHPDVYWDRDLGLYRPRIEEIFRRLTTAFEVLCDGPRRAAYDQTLEALRAPPSKATNDVVRVTTTGIHRRPVELDAVAPKRPTPLSLEAPRVAAKTPVAPRPAVDVGGVDERVPKEITLQSLMRSRSEHLAKQRRDRVSEIEERIKQAEVRNDAAEALTLLREAAALAPHDASIAERLQQAELASSGVAFERYRNLARICEKDKRWDAAVEAWIRASSERPSEVALLLAVVNASCEGLIDLPRAADYARRATAAEPKNADAFAALGRVFFLAGRLASARGAVESALRIDAKHAAALELARKLKIR